MQAILTYKRDAESKDDLQLALLELTSLSGEVPREVPHAEARKLLGCKRLPFVAPAQRTFVVDVSPETASKLVRRLAFWDLVLIRSLNDILPQSIAAGSVWACVEEILAFATQSQVMEWTAYAKDDPSLNEALRSGHALEALHDRNLAFIDAAVNAPLTPISRRKKEYLTHGFHKYKAKFFPRLARALINYTCPDDSFVVLDPYCGSGTTGVESSLMGMHAVEFDLDPLSAFIANSKVLLGHLDLAKFTQAVSTLPSKLQGDGNTTPPHAEAYRLPRFLLERKPKRLPPEVLEEIEAEATTIKDLVAGCTDGDVKALFELAFSHALATKVSLRWMGTGDNRFALEIGKRSLYTSFVAQLRYMVRKLGTWGAIRDAGLVNKYGEVEVGVSDCTSLPLPGNSVNAVVTSPHTYPQHQGAKLIFVAAQLR